MTRQNLFSGFWTKPGFYTKLNIWGSLGLHWCPIIENGGPIFLYQLQILEDSTSFREGIRTDLSYQTGVAKYQVIFVSEPFVSIGIFYLFSGLVFEMIRTKLTWNSRERMVLGQFLHFFCQKSFSDCSVPTF